MGSKYQLPRVRFPPTLSLLCEESQVDYTCEKCGMGVSGMKCAKCGKEFHIHEVADRLDAETEELLARYPSIIYD